MTIKHAGTIENLAWRSLRHLPRYKPADEERWRETSDGPSVQLAVGERVLGTYVDPGSPDEPVIVTDFGLRFRANRDWDYVPYGAMRSIATPEDKEFVDSLTVQMKDGTTKRVPVRGGEGQFRDAFTFIHFLDRVLRRAGR